MASKKKAWWKDSTGYIIYPETFCDGNDDGIGDLKGICEKLDYLHFLGVDLLWICPFFDSPMDDNGYDVRDYSKVNPRYGSNEDFRLLIGKAHSLGIRVLVDFVMNHTSDEHPWFQKALKDPSCKERGYYYFQKGKWVNGKLMPPNNWKGYFSTSVWTRIGESDEFYLHIFSKKMPDVNWGNPELREEYFRIARSYLDMGVDGFRIDAISHLGKDLTFSDSTLPLDPDGLVLDSSKFANRPEVFLHLKEFKQKVLSHYPCLTVGEAGGGISPEESLGLTDLKNGSIDMVFNFDTSWCNGAYGSLDKPDEEVRTNVLELKRNFKRWYDKTASHVSSLPVYWCNHDHPRVLSQYGSIHFRKQSGKMLLLTLLFLYGTPFLYYGDEIGMSNVTYKKPEDFFCDVSAKNETAYLRLQGYGDEAIAHHLCRCARVNARTPMQWGKGENASFSSKPTRAAVNENYKEGVNVEEQLEDPDSILLFARKAIAIRKKKWIRALSDKGQFLLPNESDEDVFAYAFLKNGAGYAVISNFRSKNVRFAFDLPIEGLVLSNMRKKKPRGKTVLLRPYESMLVKVRKGK